MHTATSTYEKIAGMHPWGYHIGSLEKQKETTFSFPDSLPGFLDNNHSPLFFLYHPVLQATTDIKRDKIVKSGY